MLTRTLSGFLIFQACFMDSWRYEKSTYDVILMSHHQRSAFGTQIPIPNPEFLKLNPKSQIFQTQSQIPIPNPKFSKLHPKSQSQIPNFPKSIPNPNPKSRIFQTPSQIPIPNPKFFKINPKSQSRIPNFSKSIPIPIPIPNFGIGIGIWSGSLGFKSRIPTSAH